MLYHVTQACVGGVLVVDRRTPRFPADKEPLTPRLCACPTVWQCLAARLLDCRRQAFVYCTEAKGVKPRGVWDAFLTDERWLLPGHRLFLCQVLGDGLLWEAQRRGRQRAGRGLKSNFRERLLSMLDACEALGERKPKWLTDSVERWCA